MKFYYNEKLVRTSKTHNYKYACINTKTQGVVQCSETKDGAMKLIETMKGEKQRGYENNMSAIKAIDEGRMFFTAKIGRSSERVRVVFNRGVYEENANECKAWLEAFNSGLWQVVELEARA